MRSASAKFFALRAVCRAAIEANRRSYGVAWPSLSFKDAKLIVSFGADFLEHWGASVPQQLDFAEARAKLDGAPRFIYVGPRRSLTVETASKRFHVECPATRAMAVGDAVTLIVDADNAWALPA